MNEYLIKLKNFTLDFWQDSDVRIYLFGSWARGEARQSSDVEKLKAVIQKIPVKSYAIMFSNDRHSPNRDFVHNTILIICKPGYGLSNSMGGLTELFWCVGGH